MSGLAQLPASPPARPIPWPAALLVLAIFAVYADSLTGPFVYDDIPSIAANPTIRDLADWPDLLLPPSAGGVTVSGRPVLNLSFALNYAISGSAVWSYHALNILIHTGAALLLFGIVRRTVGRSPLRDRFGAVAAPLAFAVAALWALHPLQTQAITYTVQRAESLMGFFYLLTLYAFVRATGAQSTDASRNQGGDRGWLMTSVAACALGMATKEVMVTAPVMVLLYDRTLVGGSFGGAWRERRRFYLALGATWLLLAGLVLSTGGNRGGSIGPGVGVSAWAYGLTQFEAVTRYLGLSIWPHPLVFEYGTFWVHGFPDVLPSAVVVLALIGVTIHGLWKNSAVGFAGAWLFGILAPSSLSPGTTQMIVEHRMYLPLAAVVALVVLAAQARFGGRALLGCGVAALALGAATACRNRDYRSAIILWSETLARRPDNPRARENLGEAFVKAGRVREGIAQYEAAVRLQPDDAQFHYNLGLALAGTGDRPAAIGQYEIAVRLAPDDANIHNNLALACAASGQTAAALVHAALAARLMPDNPEMHYNFALYLDGAGRTLEAVAEYEAALRLRPDYAEAHNNLGNAALRLGRVPEAVAHYERALRIDPNSVEAHSNLGFALLKLGRQSEAVVHYEAVLKLAPADATAHRNLGDLALAAGRAAEAIAHYDAALRTKPDDVVTLTGLGRALAQAGRVREAVTTDERALQLAPDAVGTRYNLANAWFQLGDFAAAAARYEEVVRLQPGFGDARFNLAAALVRLGRLSEAVECYEELLRRTPNDAAAHAELANLFAHLGRPAEAIAHYETALRLNPDFPAARAELERLRETPGGARP